MSDIDVAVIGAGVVGLAVGAACARRGREVIVIEAASAVGTMTSSRNSEVIHAGLYYPQGSLKARLCREGNRRLYAWCAERGVSVRPSGKLVVACSVDEIAALDALARHAEGNGVSFARLTAVDAAALEPELVCQAALLVPASGMVDSHGLMLSLMAEIERFGGTVALNTEVVGGCLTGGLALVTGGADGGRFSCRTIFNCAGLGAPEVSRRLGAPAASTPQLHLAKGSYFFVSGKPPFQRLIYPMPSHHSAGLHYALDWSGRGRFGPDLQWVDSLDYGVDQSRADAFQAVIRRFWPALPEASLHPDYAGIRPKLQGPGEPSRDFCIETARDHGVEGLVALYGIESPGLTASLALGEYVAALLG